MPPRSIELKEVRRFSEGRLAPAETDRLAVEEPLELRVGGRALAVLMRTPGDDEALAAGFLLTEGIVRAPGDIARVARPEAARAAERENILEIALAPGAAFDAEKHARNFYASSSCGICGKASLEAISAAAPPILAGWRVAAETLLALPARMRAAQPVFSETGSLHAAALFDREGALLDLAEDIGRHNAADKIVGRAARAGMFPLSDAILAVSGRISFEIAQKAAMAGAPLVLAVSGASSLAVALAEDRGMTLIGFARGGAMTVYSGAWRAEAPPRA